MEQVERAPAGPSSREYGRGALARTRALDLLSPTLVLIFGLRGTGYSLVLYSSTQFCRVMVMAPIYDLTRLIRLIARLRSTYCTITVRYGQLHPIRRHGAAKPSRLRVYPHDGAGGTRRPPKSAHPGCAPKGKR